MSEEEEAPKEKKTEQKASASSNTGIRSYFFEPNGGGPIWENILMAALLAGYFVYSLRNGGPSEEITYMDFV